MNISNALVLFTQEIVAAAPANAALGGAAVHRTHVQAVSESTAEVCATYTRGTQTFAVAGRIDRTDGTGWTVTALHVV